MKRSRALFGVAVVAFAWFLTWAVMPHFAVADELKHEPNQPISYVNEQGKPATVDAYQVVDNTLATLADGWYVLTSDVTMESPLVVEGQAQLVLTEGHTLTLEQGMEFADQSSLTLYGQEASTGALVLAGDAEMPHAPAVGASLVALPFGEVIAGADEQSAQPVTMEELLAAEGVMAYVRVRPVASEDLMAQSANDSTETAEADSARTRRHSRNLDALMQWVNGSAERDNASEQSAAKDAEEQAIRSAEDEDKQITVTFNPNGGTGTMDPMTVTASIGFILPECSFTAPEGKEFNTWTLGTPGSSVALTEDTTVSALWKDATQTDDNTSSGTGGNASTQTTGGSTSSTTSTPRITSTDPTSSSSSNSSTTSSSDSSTSGRGASNASSPDTGDGMLSILPFATFGLLLVLAGGVVTAQKQGH